METRPARIEDCEALAKLMGQLGYPISTEKFKKGFEALNFDDHEVFVALIEQKIVGWIQVERRRSSFTHERADIVGLIVDEQYRKKGVGKSLVNKALDWARKRGIEIVRVSSNLERKESHPFYQSLGFQPVKQSAAYRLDLK